MINYNIFGAAVLFFSFMFVTASNAETIELSEKNIVPIYGSISSGMAQTIALYASNLQQKHNTKLYFVIDSGGGEITESYRIVEVIEQFENAEVVVLWAASAAAGITQLTSKPVKMHEPSWIMFHRVSYYLEGGYNSKRLLEFAAELQKYEAVYFNRVGRKMKISEKTFQEMFDLYDDWYLNSTIALKRGAIDRVITAKCSKSVKNKKTTIYSSKKATDLCQIRVKI